MGLFLPIILFILSLSALGGGLYYVYINHSDFITLPGKTLTTEQAELQQTEQQQTQKSQTEGSDNSSNNLDSAQNLNHCLTYQELAQYNGIAKEHIYLSVKLDVFDVSNSSKL